MGEIGVDITNSVEPPHSIAGAKIDDKGRMKFPSATLEWCKNSQISSVFITTLDKRTIRIYPIPLWKSTLKVLEGPGESAKAGADLAFIAKFYGDDAEIDAQGRVLMPQELRNLLNLESQPVYLEHFAGRINVTTKGATETRKQIAETNLDEKVELFGKLGI